MQESDIILAKIPQADGQCPHSAPQNPAISNYLSHLRGEIRRYLIDLSHQTARKSTLAHSLDSRLLKSGTATSFWVPFWGSSGTYNSYAGKLRVRNVGQWKTRPVLLLRELPPYQDFLACGLSTQLRQRVAGFDELLTSKDDGFDDSGLVSDSIIRLGFLSVVPRRRIMGTIGTISAERHERLLQTLSAHLIRKISAIRDESE